MNSNGLITFLLGLYFYICLVFPTAFDLLIPKAVLLGILILCILLRDCICVGFKKNDSWGALIWLISICSFGLFFSLMGAINNGAGVKKMIQIYVFWPIIYYYIFSRVKKTMLQKALNISVYASAFSISVMSLTLFVSIFFGMDAYYAIVKSFGFGAEIGVADFDSIYGFTLPGLVSLVFIFGYITIQVFYSGERLSVYDLRFFAWLLTAIVCIFSGRYFLILMFILLIPFVLYKMLLLNNNGIDKISFKKLALSSIVIFVAIKLNFNLIADMLIIVYENIDGAANETRKNQAALLINRFVDHPLLGVGLGVPHPDIIRSVTSPWSYELSYHSLLYQTGIIGILLYLIIMFFFPLYVLTFNKRNRAVKYNFYSFLSSIAVGFLFTLFADSTNPYFTRFDGIWIAVLLPVLFFKKTV
jgi:hypothetical protein